MKDIKLKKLQEISSLSFSAYKQSERSQWKKVESYNSYIEIFVEKFRDDIYSLSKLSPSRIRIVAKKIIDTYDAFSQDAGNMLAEGTADSWDLKLNKFHEGGTAYMDLIFEAFWGRCWLEILPDLEKLKTEVESFVALEKTT